MDIRELDSVVLMRDLLEHGLRAGDVGAVVEAPSSHEVIVEFVTGGGNTQALVVLSRGDTRPVGPNDMPAVRRLDAA